MPWGRDDVVWVRVKEDDLVCAEVGPGRDQVLWK